MIKTLRINISESTSPRDRILYFIKFMMVNHGRLKKLGNLAVQEMRERAKGNTQRHFSAMVFKDAKTGGIFEMSYEEISGRHIINIINKKNTTSGYYEIPRDLLDEFLDRTEP